MGQLQDSSPSGMLIRSLRDRFVESRLQDTPAMKCRLLLNTARTVSRVLLLRAEGINLLTALRRSGLVIGSWDPAKRLDRHGAT